MPAAVPATWRSRRSGPGGRVTGLDFSEQMLVRAREKSDSVEWVLGDATALPFADASFDAVTVGFGIRNVPDLEARPRASLRASSGPGGRSPASRSRARRGLLKPFFRLWFDGLVPMAGKVLPGGRAYYYLPASVRRFPGPSDLAAAFGRAGFDGVGWKLMGGGIVALHVGTKR